ncbi:uncharacterized protein EKO05_0010258 [Ascochyta rabiei]|uniref:Serine-type endopeptidase n=1 Tax=Didymella rabiei TaxID=5454 RepID=A0A163F1Z2_DIDRA|nr:uncharacterized protein EKO05_0010258 [Ascochyta rabiei]KZM24089.1 serine-type endopeptidase [Ascochyta rabiei]UPX20012.1 hypothetical protein EKO05_0010258 [Ascochyta rabiei]
MPPILINGNLVDLDSGHPKNRSLDDDADKSGDYIIVQTSNVLSAAQLGTLQELGAQLQEYLAENTYLFRYAATDMTRVRQLEFVTKAGEYQRGYKVNGHLQAVSNYDPAQEKTVYLVLHQDKNTGPESVAENIAAETGLSVDEIQVDGNRIQMTVPLNKLKELSRNDLVRTVEETPAVELANTFAKQVLNGEVVINDTGYRGAGQVVAVADTGFDRGLSDDVHPAFSGRVRALIPIGREDSTNDPEGHGTHCAGSILGAKVLGGETTVEGIAPEAELVLQSLLNDLPPPDGPSLFPLGMTSDLKNMFTRPLQDHGAYIHSNSWSSKWKGAQQPYGEAARQVDEAVYEHPELLIVFAAGNYGYKTPFGSIEGYASAKNCLTVGATDSSRPSAAGRYVSSKTSLNDATEIPTYSCRGPTFEGRIKPDVVAPGTAILSAKSRDAIDKEVYGTSLQRDYMYSTGTSMSAALVSGCAAVLRETLVKSGLERPPAALLKAMLINGSYSLHHAHGGKEGFGRVNLKDSIVDTSEAKTAGFVIGQPLRDIFDDYSFTVEVPVKIHSKYSPGGHTPEPTPPVTNGLTLKATLAYTDAPGAALQNDLNLILTTSDGVSRNGNMGSDSNRYDDRNNVEQVVWKAIPPGKVRITVRAANITSKEQDFALVWKLIDFDD